MARSDEFKHNHYVPEWYQKRFLKAGEGKFWYLDLKPETRTSAGSSWTRKALLRWGPPSCFAADDLYTINWSGIANRDIERFFFGKLDREGESAVEHFSDFRISAETEKAFNSLLPYMSVQKLRTPKGLGHLRQMAGGIDREISLMLLQRIQNIYCAIWTECVWQIADASQSPTKFIISDDPVVVYNRECPPASKHCLGFNDPDIRFVASHTYFPLSIDKVLILTNLSWVRDPYQSALTVRPNPEFFRGAIFNMLDVQFNRVLTEDEVLEINYITKTRALRYVAAAEKEWLYPEEHVRSTDWRKLGDGYLLMPDPRHIHGGGEVIIGYDDGRSDAFGAYGHRPWQQGYKDKRRDEREWARMLRFKAEWAAMFGPHYRGLVHRLSSKGAGPIKKMSDDHYAVELARDREFAKRPGERQRRRRLQRPKAT